MGSLMTMLAGAIPIVDNLPSLHLGVDWLLVQMNGWFGSFAWTMIIFTIMLKVILYPLDYISRKAMKRNTMIQERLAPQLAKLEKQCKGDKTLYNQKMMVMMRKDGYKMAGACLPSLITLGLFIFIFSCLGSYTTYANASVYKEMTVEYNTIVAEFDQTLQESQEGEAADAVNDGLVPNSVMESKAVQERLAAKYKSLNPQWLWIKNTIRPDGFNTAIPTYDEIRADAIGSSGIGSYIGGNTNEAKEENYNNVMGFRPSGECIEGSIAWQYNTQGFKIFGKYLNGWFLLPLLAAGVSFLSQFLTQKMQGQAPGGTGGGAMKVMMVVFPIMMLFFAVSYTSGFSLYIITNSLCTLGVTYLANWMSGKKLVKEFERKRLDKIKTSYRR